MRALRSATGSFDRHPLGDSEPPRGYPARATLHAGHVAGGSTDGADRRQRFARGVERNPHRRPIPAGSQSLAGGRRAPTARARRSRRVGGRTRSYRPGTTPRPRRGLPRAPGDPLLERRVHPRLPALAGGPEVRHHLGRIAHRQLGLARLLARPARPAQGG